MAILFNTILIIIIFIIGVICIKIGAQIYSLKKQKEFRKDSLEQLTEKEKGRKQDLEENESSTDHPKDP
jgi:predicted Holliday junction resolvase-like endonuclease